MVMLSTVTLPVTVSVVPSKVKLALSVIASLVVTYGTRPLVKSVIASVLTITSPAPLGVILMLPLVSVLTIVLASMLILSTVKLVVVNNVPLKVKLALSTNAPLVPAYVTLVAVRSLTVALDSVASPLTFKFELMLATPVTVSVVPSKVKLALSTNAPLVLA